MLPQPGSLTEYRDRQGNPQPGLLEFTAKQLKEENPDAEIVRQEVTNIADGDVGMIAAAHHAEPQAAARAAARSCRRPTSCTTCITLKTPGAAKGAKEDEAATSERLAIETFRQVLDSVKLLDLGAVRADQDARLYRTRGLLVNLTGERLKNVAHPPAVDARHQERQGRRLHLRRGDDAAQGRPGRRRDPPPLAAAAAGGPAGRLGVDPLRLGRPAARGLVDAHGIRQREGARQAAEGVQAAAARRVRRRATGGRCRAGATCTPCRCSSRASRERLEPVGRDLPPFYLPQAVSHLLPRLVPVGEPKNVHVHGVRAGDARGDGAVHRREGPAEGGAGQHDRPRGADRRPRRARGPGHHALHDARRASGSAARTRRRGSPCCRPTRRRC